MVGSKPGMGVGGIIDLLSEPFLDSTLPETHSLQCNALSWVRTKNHEPSFRKAFSLYLAASLCCL
jgi:hypothetical protein